jgi:hypothetical protein
MQEFTVRLTETELDVIHRLASQRGVQPSMVIQQAIATENLLAANVGPGDELLIKKTDGSFRKVIFQQAIVSSAS